MEERRAEPRGALLPFSALPAPVLLLLFQSRPPSPPAFPPSVPHSALHPPRASVISPHLRRSSSGDIVPDLRRIRLGVGAGRGRETFEQTDEPGRRVEGAAVVVQRRVEVHEEIVHYHCRSESQTWGKKASGKEEQG